MGKELYNYFKKAEELGGVKARTKLSMLTKISSLQAKFIEDSSEKSQNFKLAFEKLMSEFHQEPEKLASESQTNETEKELIERLREYIKIMVDFTAESNLYKDDLKSIFNRITESISYALNCERVSIWLYDKDATGITCENLFTKSKQTHSNHLFLAKKNYPNYFKAIESERTVSANDAINDPSTSEFSDSYLKPLDITSMLDVPIWVEGKLIGVMCNEHVGPKRTWTKDEANFVYLMSCIVSMAIERTIENKKN